jgi:hypothetical protein
MLPFSPMARAMVGPVGEHMRGCGRGGALDHFGGSKNAWWTVPGSLESRTNMNWGLYTYAHTVAF